MVITEWHTPIHERQKGEVQRERCYLEPYYFFNGNLKDYSELLEYAFTKQHNPNQLQINSQYDEFLEKHPIYFHPHDIKKEQSPTHNQLKEWSKGTNTKCDEKYSWGDRRTSKRNEISKIAEENLAAQMTEDLPYFYECVKKGFKEIDQSISNSKMMGNFTPHQAESATKGRNHAVNSLLQLTGKDKDYKVKADVNADVNTETTVNNPGLNKIAEAYLNGRKQYDDESAS